MGGLRVAGTSWRSVARPGRRPSHGNRHRAVACATEAHPMAGLGADYGAVRCTYAPVTPTESRRMVAYRPGFDV